MKPFSSNADDRLGSDESFFHETDLFDRKKLLKAHILELIRDFRRQRKLLDIFIGEILRRNEQVDQVESSSDKAMGPNVSIRALIDLMVLTAQHLGDQVFEKLSLQIFKSLKTKVFTEEANQIRFASLYKMELRRHLTIEIIQQEILFDEQMMQRLNSRAQQSALMEDTDDRTLPGSKYKFRLHALERVLQAARRPPDINLRLCETTKQLIYTSDTGNEAEAQTMQNRVDVLAKKTDLSHLWVQSRCGLKIKTLIFKKLVQILSTIPLFSVSIRHSTAMEHSPSSFLDDVVEFALAASYLSFPMDSPLCFKDHPMHELFVIVEGSIGSESASCLHLGEMSLLDPDAFWSQTWRVTSPTATVFSLTSKDFDKVLTRLLGLGNERGHKRESPLSATHHSPRASYRRSSIMIRSAKARKTSRNELYKAHRNVWDEHEGIVMANEERTMHPPGLDALIHATEAVNISGEDSEARKPNHFVSSDVQYYPSFKLSAYRIAEDGLRFESDLSVFDRPFLQSMPPITFPVLKMDDIVAHALMPTLPETENAAFSSSDTNVYASLFTQPNVLKKEVLRGILQHRQTEQSDSKDSQAPTSPQVESSDTEISPFEESQTENSQEIEFLVESSVPLPEDTQKKTASHPLQDHWNRRRSVVNEMEQVSSSRPSPYSPKSSPVSRPGELVDAIERGTSFASNRRSSMDDESSQDSYSDDRAESIASGSLAVAHRIHRFIKRRQKNEQPGVVMETVSSVEMIQEGPALSSPLPRPLKPDLQQRLTKVLDQLGMTAKQKMEVVLKYTSSAHSSRFAEAVSCWEQAALLILQRESLMAKVDEFEYNASDPRRFFKTLSTKRLDEEKNRKIIIRQLHQLTIACDKALQELEKLGDEQLLCFNGEERSYREKLSRDYTEVLYAGEQKRLSMIKDRKEALTLTQTEVDRCEENEERQDVSGLTGPRLELPSLISPPHSRKWDQNNVLLRLRRQANLLHVRRQMEVKKADSAHNVSSALSSRTLAGRFQVNASPERRIPTPPRHALPSRNIKQI
uniref:Uncharacterized protein AlNc14C26G2574 n=1 Tax=Albugo laibachii Nc14 TaxID=890382 RepID=F0W6T8_9STRA|nr:conserved hypothetical protein [Albugo laibachii Nc14]|eukprot:CCA16833.1 conserved hypothetical protein [Albugo laibachii Nc14]